jgi:hypothetical protein
MNKAKRILFKKISKDDIQKTIDERKNNKNSLDLKNQES